MPSLAEWYWRIMSRVSAVGGHRAARWFIERRRFGEAAEILHPLRDRQPLRVGMLPNGFAEALHDLGLCRFHEGRHDEAAEAWRRVVAVAPRAPIAPGALYHLGSVELLKGRPVAAQALFDEAIAAAREVYGLTSPQAVRAQALAADRLGQSVERDAALAYARAAVETAIASPEPDPSSHEDALEALGRAAQGCERFGESGEAWARLVTRRATAARPDAAGVARALFGRAVAEQAAGRAAESAETLRAAYEWLGRGGEAGGDAELEFCIVNLRGVMALDEGRHRDARAEFGLSMRLAENLPQSVDLRDRHVAAARINLALSMAELGEDLAGADELLARVGAAGESPDFHVATAALCGARGEWDRAESCYRQAIAGRDAAHERAALADDHLASFYFSFLTRRNNSSNRTFNVALYSGTLNGPFTPNSGEKFAVGQFGTSTRSSNGDFALQISGGDNPSVMATAATPILVGTGVTHLVVGRVDFDVDGGVNERIRTYIDPQVTGGEPTTAYIDATSPSDLGSFDTIRPFAGGYGTSPLFGVSADFDEIRVGNSFASALGQPVPEPSVLGLAALALLGKRRRR